MASYAEEVEKCRARGPLPPISVFERRYANLVERVLKRGAIKPSRQIDPKTGRRIATRSITSGRLEVPMGKLSERRDGRPHGAAIVGFPNLSRKKLPIKLVAEELRWFLSGSTNAQELDNCRIWDSDAAKAKERGFDYPPGGLGPIYGEQWRKLVRRDVDPPEKVDQIENLLARMVVDPFDRGLLVNAFNVLEIPKMVLRPCHYAFQLVCAPGASGRSVVVDCVVSMRSTDIGLGLPFNVASYSLLTALLCLEATRRCATSPALEKLHSHSDGSPLIWPWKYELGVVVVNMADCHIYDAHADALKQYVREVNTEADVGAAHRDPRAGGTTVFLGDLTSPDAFAKMTPAQKAELDVGESFDFPTWNAPHLSLELFT